MDRSVSGAAPRWVRYRLVHVDPATGRPEEGGEASVLFELAGEVVRSDWAEPSWPRFDWQTDPPWDEFPDNDNASPSAVAARLPEPAWDELPTEQAPRAYASTALTPVESARCHMREGISVIPVPFRTKAPVVDGWQKLRLTEEELPRHFDTSPKNIGGLLGTPSGNLLDNDLDCPEALKLAASFLAATRTFGRASKPKSHYFSRATDLAEQGGRKFSDLVRGTCLVELRSTGGQTVLPGSVHECGEPIDWDDPTVPIVELTYAAQLRNTELLAAACVLLRYWPGFPAEQDAQALSDALVRGLGAEGWLNERITSFLTPIVCQLDVEVAIHLELEADARAWDRVRELLSACLPKLPDGAGAKGTKVWHQRSKTFFLKLFEWLGVDGVAAQTRSNGQNASGSPRVEDGGSHEDESAALRAIPIGDRVRRASAWLRSVPPAVSGQDGHKHTFETAVAIIRGFALEKDVGFDLISRDFNPRCQPPWSEAELVHKVLEAMDHGEMPWGAKLLERRVWKRPEATPGQCQAAKAAVEAELVKFDGKKGVQPEPLVKDVLRAIMTLAFEGALLKEEARTAVEAVANRSGWGAVSAYMKGFLRLKREVRDELAGRLPQPDAGGVVAEQVPPTLFVGDSGLILPPGHEINALHALVKATRIVGETGEVDEHAHVLTHQAFWSFEELRAPDGIYLHVAAVVRGRLVKFTLPRSILSDARKLHGALEGRGITVPSGKDCEVMPPYLSEFRQSNEARIPLREAPLSTGWDEKRETFLLGNECIGGSKHEHVFELETDEAARTVCGAIGVKGDPAVWRSTCEEMLACASAVGLLLSAAVASPMLRLFGWEPIGIVMGSLGGAGKSSMLRAGGSVFGATGSPALKQPGGVVAAGTGTVKGLLLQFRRVADLPHFADELKVDLTDSWKKNELSDTLQQLSEGREYVRATRDSRSTRVGWAFPGCAALACESDPGDFLRKGGAVRRYLPLRGPYSSVPLGEYVERLASNYGHLGRDLVGALVAASPEKRAELEVCAYVAVPIAHGSHCVERATRPSRCSPERAR